MPDINNNDLVTASVAIIILFLILTGFMIAFVLLYQRRKAKYMLEMYEIKQVYDRELLKTQLEIQEQTFQNISQEIHDNIGQVLTLAKLNLNLMRPQCSYLPQMADTYELVAKAINDLRNLSKSLNPDRIADIDLTDSIRHELQMLERTKLFTTTIAVSGIPFTIEKEKKIILFRIFQEILNNMLKHANANNIIVILEFVPGRFQLRITDNGQGFDINSEHSGIGLRNIQNRSALIGAIPQITSSPGNGTVVNLTLPQQQ